MRRPFSVCVSPSLCVSPLLCLTRRFTVTVTLIGLSFLSHSIFCYLTFLYLHFSSPSLFLSVSTSLSLPFLGQRFTHTTFSHRALTRSPLSLVPLSRPRRLSDWCFRLVVSAEVMETSFPVSLVSVFCLAAQLRNQRFWSSLLIVVLPG